MQRANGRMEIWNATSTYSLLESSSVVIDESEGQGVLAANRHIRGQFLARTFLTKNETSSLEVWEWKAPVVRESGSMLESLGASKIPM